MPAIRHSHSKPSRTGPWMLTATGHRVFVNDPRPEDFHIEDIAHALSHICRFGGHARGFYSVAQHSLLVADILQSAGRPRHVLFAGLMHDAAEAYVGDIIRPIKIQLAAFVKIESSIVYAINSRFHVAMPSSGPITSPSPPNAAT